MRASIRPVFFSERRPRVHFYTSNDHKYMQARSVFDRCGLSLTHFRSRQEPYDESYGEGRLALLHSAVEQVRGVIGSRALFFVEDTSIRVEALSHGVEDRPGLAAKEWFAETSFEALDSLLRAAGDRRATVRSDIALHVPGIQPVLISAVTEGVVAETAPDFQANHSHPWLTPNTFNGWFVPQGADRPLGAMKFEESLEYDFRVKAFLKLVDRLAEYAAVLNLAPAAYERVDRVGRESTDQVELFEGDPVPELRILMVTGHTCAGKTEFGAVAEGLGHARHVEASGVLREIGAGLGTELSGFALAARVLGELGPDVVARVMTERILPSLTQGIAVITGFRTIEEVMHVKRQYPDARLLFLRSDPRTRLQRIVQRARKGSVENMAELLARDREQESFGLLAVGLDLADDVMENDGTSDRTLAEYHGKVRALLQNAKQVPGLTRDARPRQPLSKERLYRCLHALRAVGTPLAAREISEKTDAQGWMIEQRNVNQALRDFPQFAERRTRAGAEILYEITKAGLAYLTQRVERARSVGDESADHSAPNFADPADRSGVMDRA